MARVTAALMGVGVGDRVLVPSNAEIIEAVVVEYTPLGAEIEWTGNYTGRTWRAIYELEALRPIR